VAKKTRERSSRRSPPVAGNHREGTALKVSISYVNVPDARQRLMRAMDLLLGDQQKPGQGENDESVS